MSYREAKVFLIQPCSCIPCSSLCIFLFMKFRVVMLLGCNIFMQNFSSIRKLFISFAEQTIFSMCPALYFGHHIAHKSFVLLASQPSCRPGTYISSCIYYEMCQIIWHYYASSNFAIMHRQSNLFKIYKYQIPDTGQQNFELWFKQLNFYKIYYSISNNFFLNS